ncbi:hypothetical protein TWF730_001358 [Orbilia blumenaviensis]|uniref:Alpha box domain-containing protein n=1 Tax=Orbilia blumenaviensis TaxID=1796055 RepID=A0AAV9UKU7_9PEZI
MTRMKELPQGAFCIKRPFEKSIHKKYQLASPSDIRLKNGSGVVVQTSAPPPPGYEIWRGSLTSPPVLLPIGGITNGRKVPRILCNHAKRGRWEKSEVSYIYFNEDGTLCLAASPHCISSRFLAGTSSRFKLPVVRKKTLNSGFWNHGYPKLIQPLTKYPAHIPNEVYRRPTESSRNFRRREREFEKRISLSQNKRKFCTDPTYVVPGRKDSYIDNKRIEAVEAFNKEFNLVSGTGAPELNRAPTPAQTFWRKRVSMSHKSMGPSKGREIGNHFHVVMDRVPNPEGMVPEDEVIPDTGQKRKREDAHENETPKKKRAVNAWIAFRMYHQTLFQARHHQSEVSGKIKAMYDKITDVEKEKWCSVGKEYTKGRDSFPGASRTWLSGMMASIVLKAGLNMQEPDVGIGMPTPPLVELPSKISPNSIHTPENITESQKRARENEEPEFGRVPKKARLIYATKKRRLGEPVEAVTEERRIKKIRVLKGDVNYPAGPEQPVDPAADESHSSIDSAESIFSEPRDKGSRDSSPDTAYDSDVSMEDFLVLENQDILELEKKSEPAKVTDPTDNETNEPEKASPLFGGKTRELQKITDSLGGRASEPERAPLLLKTETAVPQENSDPIGGEGSGLRGTTDLLETGIIELREANQIYETGEIPDSFDMDIEGLQGALNPFENGFIEIQGAADSCENGITEYQNTPYSFKNGVVEPQDTPDTFDNGTIEVQNTPTSFEDGDIELQDAPCYFENEAIEVQDTPDSFENSVFELQDASYPFENRIGELQNTPYPFDIRALDLGCIPNPFENGIVGLQKMVEPENENWIDEFDYASSILENDIGEPEGFLCPQTKTVSKKLPVYPNPFENIGGDILAFCNNTSANKGFKYKKRFRLLNNLNDQTTGGHSSDNDRIHGIKRGFCLIESTDGRPPGRSIRKIRRLGKVEQPYDFMHSGILDLETNPSLLRSGIDNAEMNGSASGAGGFHRIFYEPQQDLSYSANEGDECREGAGLLEDWNKGPQTELAPPENGTCEPKETFNLLESGNGESGMDIDSEDEDPIFDKGFDLLEGRSVGSETSPSSFGSDDGKHYINKESQLVDILSKNRQGHTAHPVVEDLNRRLCYFLVWTQA